MIKKNIKVSVCVITYNHECYIEECLNSILHQKTNFNYEILVGDDFSNDGTRSILTKFQSLHPEKIVLIFQNTRSGGSKNYEDTHAAASGEYIAHVDGDDILRPGKLQLQVDKFDSSPDINILWHRVSIFNQMGSRCDRPEYNSLFVEKKISREDLVLFGPFGPHSSTMYRRINQRCRNINFNGNDWFISFELIQDGYGLMMNEVLGEYRIHSGGLSGGSIANKKNRILLCRCQLEILKLYPEYASTISLRSLVLALYDMCHLKGYFIISLAVFFKSKAIPNFKKIRALISFFKASKLPGSFK